MKAPFEKKAADEIRSYFTETAFDYRTLWFDEGSRAMHFGYENDGKTPHSDSLINSNKVLAKFAKIGRGDRVLDAGCGMGGTSLWLAGAQGANVVGITLGRDQAAAATEEAGRRSLLMSASFLVGDFTAMPFADGAFDVVWVQESLCHAFEKEKFFREAARVLSLNGRLILADGMLTCSTVSVEDRALLRDWYESWSLSGLWTAAQHANAATAAGFSQISITDVTAYTRASQRRLYERARRAQPFANLLSLAGVRNPVQDRNVVGALKQYEALKRECWFYGIMLAHKMAG